MSRSFAAKCSGPGTLNVQKHAQVTPVLLCKVRINYWAILLRVCFVKAAVPEYMLYIALPLLNQCRTSLEHNRQCVACSLARLTKGVVILSYVWCRCAANDQMDSNAPPVGAPAYMPMTNSNYQYYFVTLSSNSSSRNGSSTSSIRSQMTGALVSPLCDTFTWYICVLLEQT